MDRLRGRGLGNLCLGGFNTDIDHFNRGRDVDIGRRSLREECKLGDDVDLQGWGVYAEAPT